MQLQFDASKFEIICRETIACNHCFHSGYVRRSFVDIAQPRFIGTGYWQARQRNLFLFVNPGAGHSSAEDIQMRKDLHAFHDGHLKLGELFARQRNYMPRWGRNGSFLRYFNEIKVNLDDIALLNVAWCGSEGEFLP